MTTPPDGRQDLIQLRRDVDADWAAVNPVLAYGEPGWDANGTLKIGDGVTAWNALPAIGGGGASGPAGGALAGTYPNPTLSSAILNAIIANGTPGAEGLALLLTANVAAVFANLGLGTAATQASSAFDAAGAAAAAQAASQPHSATVLDALVSNGAPGATGLAILLETTAAAVLATLGTGTAALVNTGTGGANVPTITQADARYAPFTPTTGAGLGTTGTVNLDFSTLNQTVQSIGQTGALTFTTSNLTAGRQLLLLVKNTTGGALGVTCPAWIVLGTLVTSIPAGKTLGITVTVPNGATTDAATVANMSLQP